MKSNIIEFIGPPGVGKSTIYKALCKTWKPNAKWIYQAQLLQIEKPPFSNPKLWMEYQVRKMINRSGNPNLPVDYGMRFAENNEAVAEFLWGRISGLNNYDEEQVGKKFRSAYFLFRDFCRYQAIWEKDDSRPCIIDEGLFVKSFFILADEKAMIELVENYLPLLNPPRAVVYINSVQKDLVVNRILSRKKVIASHKGMDRNALLADVQKWQFLFKLITEKVACYNVPVFYIDGMKPIAENVNLLGDLLNSQL